MVTKRAAFILCFILIFLIGKAQDEPKSYAADRVRFNKEVSYENDFAVSIGFNTDLPIGDWKKYASFGFGPELGLWYHLNDEWCVTGRFVYNSFSGKQYVLAGYPGIRYGRQKEWYFNPGIRYNFNQNLWVNPEVGYFNNSFETKKEGGVTWGISAGADIFGPMSIIGVGLGYQKMNFDGLSHNHIGLRVRIYFGVDREKVNEEE